MDLKTTFITKAITEYNQDITQLMRSTMIAKKVGVTGEAASSIAYQVSQSGAGAVSKLSFKEYLRFVDMGVGRSHPLGGLKQVNVYLAAQNKSGKALVKDNTFKPKKIYAKVVYGKLGSLYGKLLYGFTEETINILKAELQNQNSNTQII